MATEIFGNLGGIFGALIDFGILAAMLAVLGIIVFLAMRSGLIKKRKYQIMLFSPRSSGYLPGMVSGDFLKDGKFEVCYGRKTGSFSADIVTVEAPKEKAIHFGNMLFGYAPSRDTIYWLENININETEISADPANSEAMKSNYANMVEEDSRRYSKKNPLIEYAPHMALMAAAIILVVGIWFGLSKVSEEQANVASALNNVAAKFNNATITKYVSSSSSGQTYVSPVPNQNPNAPSSGSTSSNAPPG